MMVLDLTVQNQQTREISRVHMNDSLYALNPLIMYLMQVPPQQSLIELIICSISLSKV